MTDDLWIYGHQTIDSIIVSPISGEPIALSASNIAENGLVLNRSCVSGDKLAYGECIAAQLELTIINDVVNSSSGARRYDNVNFAGATIIPIIRTTYNGNSETTPLGVFYVDNYPLTKAKLQLVCYDSMVTLDAPLSEADLMDLFGLSTRRASPTDSLLSVLVQLSQSPYSFFTFGDSWDAIATQYANKNITGTTTVFMQIDPTETEWTCRKLLQRICEYLGCCAYFGTTGKLEAFKYHSFVDRVDAAIGRSDIKDVEVRSAPITMTGLTFVFDDKTETAPDGTDEYAYEIVDNPFWAWTEDSNDVTITNNMRGLAHNLYDATTMVTYVPMSVNCFKFLAFLKPGDYVSVQRTATQYERTIITNITYTLGEGTFFESTGLSPTAEGWAARAHTKPRKGSFSTLTTRQLNVDDILANKLQSTSGNTYFDAANGKVVLHGIELYDFVKSDEIVSVASAYTSGAYVYWKVRKWYSGRVECTCFDSSFYSAAWVQNWVLVGGSIYSREAGFKLPVHIKYASSRSSDAMSTRFATATPTQYKYMSGAAWLVRSNESNNYYDELMVSVCTAQSTAPPNTGDNSAPWMHIQVAGILA